MKKLTILAIIGIAAGAFSAHAEEPGYEGHGKKMLEHLKAVDADGDGSVSREEFAAHAATRFGTADADGNGTLSEQELIDFRKAERRNKHFSKLDTDADGVISAEEFSARADKHFEKMDRNDDGVLDADDGGRRKHRRRHRH